MGLSDYVCAEGAALKCIGASRAKSNFLVILPELTAQFGKRDSPPYVLERVLCEIAHGVIVMRVESTWGDLAVPVNHWIVPKPLARISRMADTGMVLGVIFKTLIERI